MQSKNTNSKANRADAKDFADVIAKKKKVTVYLYPETIKTLEELYEDDNCSTRTEFIEKAIRFYCGYLLQNKPELVEYLAPQICTITEGIIKGSEQRLARAIFKLAVESGVQSHIIAALNGYSMDEVRKVRNMVTEDVRRVNGIINFERAQWYQMNE